MKNSSARKKTSAERTGGRPREFSREKALAAAMHVFGEKGFDGASLTGLTRAMGINRPSMYLAFGSKEDLFREALAQYSDAGSQHVSECLSQGSARDGVEKLLRDGVAMFTDPNGMGGCFVTQGPLTGPDASLETRRDYEQRRTAVERALRKRFDRAIETGELPKGTSTEDLARFFSVMVQGIALQAQHGGTKEQLMRVVDVAMLNWPKKAAT